MQRRTFIHLSAYTAIALALPLAEGCTPSIEKILEQPLFFAHLVDAKTIRETGNVYRKLFPAENNKTTLTGLLLGNNSTTKDRKTILMLLDYRVQQDFKTGKTVVASGWVLSITEARQCALYSIINA
jgi:hypothetical protein